MTGALRRARLIGLAALLTACGTGGILGGRGEPTSDPARIVIGSKDHPEPIVVAKLYGETLTAHGYAVEYRHTIAADDLLTPATETSGIDLFPEYTGSEFSLLAGARATAGDDAYLAVIEEYAERDQAVLPMAPAIHAEALGVTAATAQELGIVTVSELVEHAGELTLGAPGDCIERAECLPGLTEAYGIEFAAVEEIDAQGLRYQALLDGQIDVAWVVTTDAEIAAHGLVVLEDDREFSRAFHLFPVVSRAYLDDAPSGFESLVNRVTARITTEELSELNTGVQIELRDATDVALEWLRDQELVEPTTE